MAIGTQASTPRVHEIDFVRGAALFGILVVNIFYYALPTEIAGGIPALDDRPGLLAWGVVSALFEFKFFSLFSLLFGMSLVLQRQSLLSRRGASAVVERDGTVGDVKLLTTLRPDLDKEAIRAAKDWRFVPGMKDGKPVPVRITLELTFTLR